MMSGEAVKIIASLCMVAAGDKNDMASAVDQVETSQIECHRYYAKCYDTKFDWMKCLSERKTHSERFNESIKK